ncbi:carbohydrate ABC transporter permease [Georgenia muralis]|uniref:Carbohydrate ABC transporter membrane protein 1 (CUT1 family) n=1 Tax=Georgenia muralis TaxID=154117 RepID=A0A3N4ZMM6_9MICO|nr:sugar ABC transporter permease [Georgenia muralis]RPF27018.1 carbohydrate ABC transporter membrane protein 1 (CUT1 family) [Georgenia muralis]
MVATTAAPPGTRPTRPRRSVATRRDTRDAWILVSPATVIIIAVILVPVLWNAILAFQDLGFRDLADGRLFGTFTLENFTDTLTSAGFWRSLWTTVVYSVSTTAGSIAVGLIAALAFRNSFRGRGALRSFMLLPYVAPVVAVTFVWEVMLNPQYGIINHYGTRFLGWDQPIDFLGRAPFAFLTVVGFEIWRYFPFAFMFLTARLSALPREIEEAALVDGVTPSQNFRHIVLPQLMPTIALLSVLRLIMTFNKFDDVFLLTGGTAGTEVSAVRVYNQLIGSFDVGGAAATALVLAVIMAVFLVFYMRIVARREELT